MFLIQTDGLRKSFADTVAVDNLSLEVPAKSVFGFLGPNGAGKTTTIRMLLGLTRPSGGKIRLFGKSLNGQRSEILSRIGALVESPSFYGHLTGRENLEVTRRLLGAPASRIDEVLRLFDIHGAADKQARKYSLGMQQRLALALAMLSDPQLLILDEPTNGLDPAGIQEIRSLIRSLPETTGVTVFISSHLLSEIEKVASHVAILAKGRLLFQGSLADFNNARKDRIEVLTDDPSEALSLLQSHGFEGRICDGTIVLNPMGEDSVCEVAEILVGAGRRVRGLREAKPSLEESFMELTRSEDEAGR